MPDWAIWLIVAIVLALGELAIFTGFILGPMAAAAALTAAVVAGFGAETEVQLGVFSVSSAIMIAALRPIAKRHLTAPPEILTNAQALLGKRARVLETVAEDAPGLIRLENENWTARPVPGSGPIKPEIHVRVVEIAGATAIVEPLGGNSESEGETS
ncbi:MAG: NfeD family protein [Actinobacteria bacterium]|nr:NfeD family protein [Actinomycetota bacterium]